MIPRPIVWAALLSATPWAAAADGHETCPLSYETYEISVPHTDLETCPAAMDAQGAYCRVSVVAEVATIFAFSEENDCLVASKSFFEDEFSLSFQ